MTRRCAYLCISLLVMLVWSCPAARADLRNLEPGLPILVEDAYVLPRGAAEFRGGLRYGLEEDGDEVLALVPEFAIGILPNLQARARVYLGTVATEEFESLDLQIGALYNFFDAEEPGLPAFAVATNLKLPAGDDSEGVDFTLKGIATTELGKHRFHANVAHTFVGEPGRRERSRRWLGGVGYDLPLSDDVLLVGDVAGFSSVNKGEKTVYMLEVGARMQVDTGSVVSGSVGGGFGGSDEAPRFTITVGYQMGF